MGRLDTELLGLQIVALDSASIVGEVDGLIVDDVSMKVAGFLVDLGLYEARCLPFEAALAIGDDAVVVETAGDVRPVTSRPKLENLARRDITVSFARAITKSGRSLGTTGDFLIDAKTGDILGIEVIPAIEGDRPMTEPMLIAASGIHKLGREVVVLLDEVEQHVMEHAAQLPTPSSAAPREMGPAAAPPLFPAEEAEDGLEDTVTDVPAPDLGAPTSTEEEGVAEEPRVAFAEPTLLDARATLSPIDDEAGEASAEADLLPQLTSSVETAEIPEEVAVAASVAIAEIETSPLPRGEAAAEPEESTSLPAQTDVEATPLAAEEAPELPPTPPSDAQPRHFLLGKRVLRRIEDPEGALIAEAGDTVSYEMIQHAKSTDQLLILSLNVE